MRLQQRLTRAMRGLAEWKPKLRWLMRRMRLLSPSRRPLDRFVDCA
jgi:hypothetical protein